MRRVEHAPAGVERGEVLERPLPGARGPHVAGHGGVRWRAGGGKRRCDRGVHSGASTKGCRPRPETVALADRLPGSALGSSPKDAPAVGRSGNGMEDLPSDNIVNCRLFTDSPAPPVLSRSPPEGPASSARAPQEAAGPTGGPQPYPPCSRRRAGSTRGETSG